MNEPVKPVVSYAAFLSGPALESHDPESEAFLDGEST
jgi:hypothetical protein